MPYRLTLAAALAALSAVPALAQTPAAPPKLVVFLTVDQLRPEYFTRFSGQLQGGLARLWNEGAVFTDAHQDHGVTETAPGHAGPLSGRFPRGTGIVRNVEGVQDSASPLVGSEAEGGGASPRRFRGTALFDWVQARDPRSRALSVSRKDRGAILPLGRARQQVYWYDYAGRFVTSRYYADSLPDWVQRFNARGEIGRLRGRAWPLLLPAGRYPERDAVPEEGAGDGYTFPHRVPADSAGAARRAADFPWMDDITLALALEGVNELRLGAGEATDVLAVSLSSTDAVGHRYGPDSREIHDQVLRLDRVLGVFLDSLYRLRDPRSVVIALTADHGVAPFPALRHPGAEADSRQIRRAPFQEWLHAELRALGVDSAAVEFDDGLVYVDRDAFAAAGKDPAELARRFVDFARTVPGVMRADLREALAADSATSTVARRWAHMLPADEPVAALVTLRPWYVWGPTLWAQHGSPHDYDSHVPVIFHGAPFRAGKYGRFARVVDIAPTLARVLGVAPAEAIDGRVLEEAVGPGN